MFFFVSKDDAIGEATVAAACAKHTHTESLRLQSRNLRTHELLNTHNPTPPKFVYLYSPLSRFSSLFRPLAHYYTGPPQSNTLALVDESDMVHRIGAPQIGSTVK